MPSDSTVFVDTNVLLYAFDDRDESKREGARHWLAWCWTTQRGRISSQVINEFYANALRKFSRSLPKEKARLEVRRLRAWKPWPTDDETVDDAWLLQDQYSLSYWDALMIAAASQQGCAYFLSEDLQHGQQIDGIEVVNPFVVGPDHIATTAP